MRARLRDGVRVVSALSETERRAFAQLAADLPADPFGRLGGRTVADLLRVTAPEVDDVTLGRIALQLSRHLKDGRDVAVKAAEAIDVPTQLTRAAALEIAIRQLTCAALNLTELEWREPPR